MDNAQLGSHVQVESKASQENVIYAAAILPNASGRITCKGLEPGDVATVIPCGDVAILGYELPKSMFVGEDAERRLTDPLWITPRAIAHEQMLVDAMQHADIMPLPFGTVFSSEEVLCEQISRRLEDIHSYFARAAGCEEWTLKVTAESEDFIADLVETELKRRVGNQDESQGLAYLKMRQQSAQIREEVVEELLTEVENCITELDETSVDSEDLPTGKKADDDSVMLAHWAFLVPRDKAGQLRDWCAEVESNMREGVALEWAVGLPPYTFVRTPQPDEAQA